MDAKFFSIQFEKFFLPDLELVLESYACFKEGPLNQGFWRGKQGTTRRRRLGHSFPNLEHRSRLS